MQRKSLLCFLCSAFCLLFTVFTILAQPVGSSQEEKVFADGVGKYVQLQHDLERSAPAQKPITESEQLAGRQNTLAGRIAAARPGSRQGDIFSPGVAKQFVKIIRKAFGEPGGRAMRRTILERNPVRFVVLHVNDVYPEDLTRTTMPPTLLRRLPTLPEELAYRIIGRALVLEDIRANLIVDFIPKAIP
jgi:hypothetical protein